MRTAPLALALGPTAHLAGRDDQRSPPARLAPAPRLPDEEVIARLP